MKAGHFSYMLLQPFSATLDIRADGVAPRLLSKVVDKISMRRLPGTAIEVFGEEPLLAFFLVIWPCY